jgi:hypothetical protein
MPKSWPILTNFTAGEFSPLLEGRVDIARYFNSAQIIENFIIEPYGGIRRRPGSVFVAQTKYNTKKVRLLSFQFSSTENYIIEMGDQYMRFYRDSGTVTEAAFTITGATQANPVVVTTSAAHGYSNGDTVIIQNVAGMTELNGRRFLAANVTATTFELTDLFGTNIDGTGFTAYTSGGTVVRVYEIASPYLEAELFEVQMAQNADIAYMTHNNHPVQILSRLGETNWTINDVEFDPMPFQPINKDNTLTMNPSATTGSITITASSAYFNANMVGADIRIAGKTGTDPERQGYAEITGFNSSTSVNATVHWDLEAAAATDDWAIGSFSDDAGYPTTVTFHEQRLFLGGTTKEPSTVKGSETLSFDSFNPGANDADALDYQIATEQVNRIRWFSSGRDLGIGTSGGAFMLSSGSDSTPLTPSNVQVRRQSSFGSELVVPQIIDTFTYYVQRGGRRLREFAYNFEIDRHRSLDMTLLAEHVTESGLTEMDYQQSPNSIIWAVRSDGEIACLTRQIDQEVIGWSRQVSGETTAGACPYESVSIIPLGEEDQIWTSVKRTVDGTERRYVEYLKPFDFGAEQKDAFFVDSGLTYDGAPETVLTGLHHLEGETVTILSDGAVVPDKVVTDGSITLDFSTEKAHVGLSYTSEVESMRLEAGAGQGTAQGKIGRIYECVFRFNKTLGAQFGVRGQTDIIPFRNTNDQMNQPPPLFTGDKRQQFPKGYQRGMRIFVTQEQPLPLTLLAIMPKLELFDR